VFFVKTLCTLWLAFYHKVHDEHKETPTYYETYQLITNQLINFSKGLFKLNMEFPKTRIPTLLTFFLT